MIEIIIGPELWRLLLLFEESTAEDFFRNLPRTLLEYLKLEILTIIIVFDFSLEFRHYFLFMKVWITCKREKLYLRQSFMLMVTTQYYLFEFSRLLWLHPFEISMYFIFKYQ